MESNSKEKPHRGMTMVASHFNGWYDDPDGMRAFRYATLNLCRVPTARYLLSATVPAVETAGYLRQMPTASFTLVHN